MNLMLNTILLDYKLFTSKPYRNSNMITYTPIDRAKPVWSKYTIFVKKWYTNYEFCFPGVPIFILFSLDCLIFSNLKIIVMDLIEIFRSFQIHFWIRWRIFLFSYFS